MNPIAQPQFLSPRRRAVAIAALLALGIATAALAPSAASSSDTHAATEPEAMTHTEWLAEGVDWAKVSAAPIDAGASVAAYDR